MEYEHEVDPYDSDLESLLSFKSEGPICDRKQQAPNLVEERKLDCLDTGEKGPGGRPQEDASQPPVRIVNSEAHQLDSAFEHAGVAHLVHGWIQQNQVHKVCILSFDDSFLISSRVCTSPETYPEQVPQIQQ
jgi:hypothetical protein